ncbi:FAD-dependent monooxygenase [Saccharopolyspora hattusasensis]|uniref:FAD-dependent monooxygenase n=1 Tax=Saccharopolyspora hattusasensis TaxID=1128679 RepID=UPI003D969DC8
MRNVLISGASIAGPALAYWLRRKGFSVTVVERAPGQRKGRQAVDIRGVALEVMDRMGLGEHVRAARTRMRGMSMVDDEGNELFRSEEQAFSSGRLGGEDVELLREDLTAMLYEVTKDQVEYVFHDSISALEQDEHGVRVEFDHGGFRTFDFVIGADGAHSAVRRLAFGPEQQFSKHLGQYLAIFPAANFLGLNNWQFWFHDEESGTGGAIYPVRDNAELRVTLGFLSEPVTYDHRDVSQQKQIVTDRLAGLGWEVPKLLAAMADAPDFHFDAMAQIHMDRWTTGLVRAGRRRRLLRLGAVRAGHQPGPGRRLRARRGTEPVRRRSRRRVRRLRAADAPVRRPQPGAGHREPRWPRVRGVGGPRQERHLTGHRRDRQRMSRRRS